MTNINFAELIGSLKLKGERDCLIISRLVSELLVYKNIPILWDDDLKGYYIAVYVNQNKPLLKNIEKYPNIFILNMEFSQKTFLSYDINTEELIREFSLVEEFEI